MYSLFSPPEISHFFIHFFTHFFKHLKTSHNVGWNNTSYNFIKISLPHCERACCFQCCNFLCTFSVKKFIAFTLGFPHIDGISKYVPRFSATIIPTQSAIFFFKSSPIFALNTILDFSIFIFWLELVHFLLLSSSSSNNCSLWPP